jgi:hypothetical protein
MFVEHWLISFPISMQSRILQSQSRSRETILCETVSETDILVYQREPINWSSRADATCSHQHSCLGRKKAIFSNLYQTGGRP